MSYITITFPDEFKKYNGEYELRILNKITEKYITIYNYTNGVSLLINEGNSNYIIVDPETNDVKFYDLYDDGDKKLKSEFYLDEYENGYLNETFLHERLKKYKKIEVKVERHILSLFQKIYNNMDFEQRLKYMKSAYNRNVMGLKGVIQIFDININMTSKDNNLNQIVNCDCVMFDSNYQEYICYIFNFDTGYIEVIYESFDYFLEHNKHESIKAKIVLDDESYDGFFVGVMLENNIEENFKNPGALYRYMQHNEDDILEFRIGHNV